MTTAIAGLLLATGLATGAPVRYEVVPLLELPPVADDVAPAIDTAGDVAAWSRTADGLIHALLRRGGKEVDIGPAGTEATSSVARALNERGQAAGWFVRGRNLVDSTAASRAFLWSDGRTQDLGTLGGRDSQAMGLDDAGTAVGVARRADGTRHAFAFQRGRMDDLGTLPGGTFSTAAAINAHGLIVGSAETAAHRIHAVVWRHRRIRDLGTLPGGGNSRALAVNDRGQIVGFSEVGGAEIHAFVAKDGRLVDLGSLGESPVRANAINNHGQVVGSSGMGRNERHAFLWEDGRITDLNRALDPPQPWQLRDAHAINDRREILCTGMRDSGPAWLLLLRPVPR